MFFASKLTRKIHADVIDLYKSAPLFTRFYAGEEAHYFGNDVMYVSDPEIELELEWIDEDSDDIIAPHFRHYPSGMRVWLGLKPSQTVHSKITESEWDQIVAECRRMIDAHNRQQAA